jgi:CSLREA domain-containing protein
MKIKFLIAISCSALVILLFAHPTLAAIYTVNSTLDLPDGNTGDGVCATALPNPVCTLRAAVMQANAHTGIDYITVPTGIYVLTRAGDDATGMLGDLDVTDELIIEGSGSSTIIDANGVVTADRAFEVLTGTLLTLQSVTIQNGHTPGDGGAIGAAGNLHLINVTIQNNTAQRGGGLFASGADISIESSTIQNNTAQGNGGGGAVLGSGSPSPSVNIVNSFIENNRSLNGGGLVVGLATASIQGTTLRNNTAQVAGGGLNYYSLSGFLSVTNTLIISNSATSDDGGGLRLLGNASLSNSQIVSNVAQSGGGLRIDNGALALSNVAISANTALSCGGLDVRSGGDLNLNHGWVENNVAQSDGGGLCIFGTIHMADTVVLNNHAAVRGGGILLPGAGNELFAARSAIYQNRATRGGGIYVSSSGLATIEDSTVSGNSALQDGGGLYADTLSTVQLNSATVANNAANSSFPSTGAGGGIYISNTATVNGANTLIGGNTNVLGFNAPSDCFGTLHSESYNFIGSNVGCIITGDSTGNQVGGAPMIAPLSWLTGLTPGHLPLSGSPVINAGRPSGCQSAGGSTLLIDQLGHNRALGGRCDIGAIEYFDIQRAYLPLTRK